MMPPAAPASPTKSALEEIETLRCLFASTLSAYAANVEAEIAKLQEALSVAAKKKKPSAKHLRDARDMVTLIRTLQVKSEKGRRRDLKKIEGVIEDLGRIVKHRES